MRSRGSLCCFICVIFFFLVFTNLQAQWVVRTIDSGAFVSLRSFENSMCFDATGKLTIAYYYSTDGDLKVWHDVNDNLISDTGELTIIDSSGNVGSSPSLGFSTDGYAVVSYYDGDNYDLKLWYDGNGNFQSDPGEIRIIDSTGRVGRYSSLAFDNSGKVNVSYFDGSNGRIKLWHDTNGDFDVDSGEIRIIRSTGLTGGKPWSNELTFSSVGHACDLFFVMLFPVELRLWYDANGNFQADSGEIKLVDNCLYGHASIGFDSSGLATVSYFTSEKFKLWHDANGNFQGETAERELIQSSSSDGQSSSLDFNPIDNKVAVAYCWYDEPKIKFWKDNNGNFSYNSGEIETVCSFASLDSVSDVDLKYNSSGRPFVSFHHKTWSPSTSYLKIAYNITEVENWNIY
ncbi:hypothetical protein J7M23_00115 [Candidatus Sumerlaeota bacterium]|nr:hypothetical protein [Candidatus Sumerlaeota bacterium]